MNQRHFKRERERKRQASPLETVKSSAALSSSSPYRGLRYWPGVLTQKKCIDRVFLSTFFFVMNTSCPKLLVTQCGRELGSSGQVSSFN